MLNVRLAGHLYGKQLFTWLSLVVSLMASLLSFFPLDVLDEIWKLIESVSEGFLHILIDCRISFYSQTMNMLPRKPKISLHLSVLDGFVKVGSKTLRNRPN